MQKKYSLQVEKNDLFAIEIFDSKQNQMEIDNICTY